MDFVNHTIMSAKFPYSEYWLSTQSASYRYSYNGFWLDLYNRTVPTYLNFVQYVVVARTGRDGNPTQAFVYSQSAGMVVRILPVTNAPSPGPTVRPAQSSGGCPGGVTLGLDALGLLSMGIACVPGGALISGGATLIDTVGVLVCDALAS